MNEPTEVSVNITITIKDDRFSWRTDNIFKGCADFDIRIPTVMMQEFNIKPIAKLAMRAAIKEYLASLDLAKEEE